MKSLLAVTAALALSGCAGGLVPWVHAHAQGLAAIGLVAGTAATVEQAVVNADELLERARRHAEEGKQ